MKVNLLHMENSTDNAAPSMADSNPPESATLRKKSNMENSTDNVAPSMADSNPPESATLSKNALKKQLKAQKREEKRRCKEEEKEKKMAAKPTSQSHKPHLADHEDRDPNVLLFSAMKPQSEPSAHEYRCDRPSPLSQNHFLSSSMSSSFRIVVVGDIHEDWKLEHDFKALHFLQPDMVLFTGDFGNENVELVKGIAKLNFPKGVILGNHDSWSTCKFSKKVKDGVQVQLECLGEAHVGYDHLDFSPLKLSVVGGRPFSCGGNQLFRKKLITARYGVHNMEESAEQIYKAALQTPKENSIILLSHNGPRGLGSCNDDICGIDWEPEGGDNGDPDLAQAILQLKETTKYSIPLVVFGHMHKELACGGSRKMIAMDADNTMYLNAAIVPRVKYPSSRGSIRAFTVVEFSDCKITKVVETWVSIIDDKASVEEEHFLFSNN